MIESDPFPSSPPPPSTDPTDQQRLLFCINLIEDAWDPSTLLRTLNVWFLHLGVVSAD